MMPREPQAHSQGFPAAQDSYVVAIQPAGDATRLCLWLMSPGEEKIFSVVETGSSPLVNQRFANLQMAYFVSFPLNMVVFHNFFVCMFTRGYDGSMMGLLIQDMLETGECWLALRWALDME